jgi:uncharacterized protein YuzE
MSTQEKTLYQWIGGEKAGQVVAMDRIEYDSEDQIHYIYFENGDRVNAELEGQIFGKIDSAEDAFVIKEEIIHDIREEKGQDGQIYEIPGPDHGKVKTIKIPKAKITSAQESVATSLPQKTQVTKMIGDPVISLLEKAKKNKSTFEISLRVDVINQALYDVITENYEDGEEKSLDYIVSLIDISELKSQLREKLKTVYNGKGN